MGVLCLDKAVGETSHDVVARVRHTLGLRQVGHTGTLDPFATGLLLITVGPATRLARYTHTLPKTYEATITLGAVSTTDDVTGIITTKEVREPPSLATLEAALAHFRGPLQQLPPTYAAIKKDGRKLYEYARAGETVESSARSVTIYSLDLLNYHYPALKVRIKCSTGTYIRALGRDIGEALHTGGYVTTLRRTQIGHFNVAGAQPSTQLNRATLKHYVQPSLRLVEHLPTTPLSNENVAQLRQGRAIPYSGAPLPTATPLAATAPDGTLVGIVEYDATLLHPRTILAT